MKLLFTGVGGAFADDTQYQTNAVLLDEHGKKGMLIDCGSDARHALKLQGIVLRDIDAVYISHLHSDHVGGMEWLAFSTYFNPTLKRPTLFCDHKLMRQMWEETLKGGLSSIEGQVMNLTNYFDCKPVYSNQSLTWDKATANLVQTVHTMAGYQIVHSYGLMLSVPKKNPPTHGSLNKDRTVNKIFYTSDTQFAPNQIRCFYEEADMIFHDCETGKVKSGVHSHYDDLKTLDPAFKKKMWLMHYQPQFVCLAEMKAMALRDGFAGFVERGQLFDLSELVDVDVEVDL